TRDQYLNTVHDLLGVDGVVARSALPGDDTLNDRFANHSSSPVQAIDVNNYADAAEAIAQKVEGNLAAVLPCSPQPMGEAACATKFIETFGKRAYRRPLTPEEIQLAQ